MAAAPVRSADVLRDASAACQAGDMPAAIRLYREFLTHHPYAAEIRSNMGAALVRNGQFAEAMEMYRLAIEDLPNNRLVRMNVALAYYKLGRLAEAIAQLEVLQRQQPVDLKPALLLADCRLQTGQTHAAVELLTPLSAEYSDDHAVTYMLGMALLKDNRLAGAQRILDRILRDGESAESEYLLGQSEFLRQNPIAAAAHLARAVELNPVLPGAHSLYGQVLRGLSKIDKSAAQFRDELKVNAYDFVANTETAMLLKHDGKLEEALVHIVRALQVRPGDPGAVYQRASVHMLQGNMEEARGELEQLVREYPSFAEAHATLATAYYRMKRTADGDRGRAAARGAQEAAAKPKQ